MMAESVTITVGAGSWFCPGCRRTNETRPGYGWCFPAQCAGCGQWWAECPDEDCYGLGKTCPGCGGTTNGMVRQDAADVVRLVCISAFVHGEPTLVRVPLLWELGGLVVNPAVEGNTGYSVTHFRSGMAVALNIETERDAIDLAERLLAVGDWDRDAHELKPGSAFARRARKVRAAWRKAHP